ncbi:MAG: hypothetical protein JRG73_12360 [Deltaproteobacteria bacterium]|nr:hypothetical protein [Deltaproteobacteria bacterium]
MESQNKSRLRAEIEALKRKLEERERSLPAHGVRPHQIQAIERLEEEIRWKIRELESLED